MDPFDDRLSDQQSNLNRLLHEAPAYGPSSGIVCELVLWLSLWALALVAGDIFCLAMAAGTGSLWPLGVVAGSMICFAIPFTRAGLGAGYSLTELAGSDAPVATRGATSPDGLRHVAAPSPGSRSAAVSTDPHSLQAMTAPAPEVQAAGGLIVRDGRVCVVHRPRYDDWSLPKGKLEPGETFEAAALREVEEEARLRCTLGAELDADSYLDHKGRGKLVRWWRMDVAQDLGFAPNEEVDELRWLVPAEAVGLLSYPHDRALVTAHA